MFFLISTCYFFGKEVSLLYCHTSDNRVNNQKGKNKKHRLLVIPNSISSKHFCLGPLLFGKNNNGATDGSVACNWPENSAFLERCPKIDASNVDRWSWQNDRCVSNENSATVQIVSKFVWFTTWGNLARSSLMLINGVCVRRLDSRQVLVILFQLKLKVASCNWDSEAFKIIQLLKGKHGGTPKGVEHLTFLIQLGLIRCRTLAFVVPWITWVICHSPLV